MWNDVYLRFENKQAWLELGFEVEGEAVATETLAFDVVGTVYRSDGTASAGYHVNARCVGELPELLKPFEIAAPALPKRVFLGVGDA
jgi:hypothetical protein